MEEEVIPGGAAPAEGEEGGRSRSSNGPGRAPYWGPAGITPPETPVSDAAGAPHLFFFSDEATGSEAGEAAAKALAEAAVDAVYGALVAATLEEVGWREPRREHGQPRLRGGRSRPRPRVSAVLWELLRRVWRGAVAVAPGVA